MRCSNRSYATINFRPNYGFINVSFIVSYKYLSKQIIKKLTKQEWHALIMRIKYRVPMAKYYTLDGRTIQVDYKKKKKKRKILEYDRKSIYTSRSVRELHTVFQMIYL